MSYGFGLMIESLVAFLLMLTIGYCMILNQRLKRLKADEHSLKATIAELITVTEMAERAVAGLKTTAHECEDTLGERLQAAERCCEELIRQNAAGEALLARVTRVVVAGRALNEIPTAAAAPDPKAVAAAARSFADRLRERVGALAA
ncbi:MAG: DUF6468 domain-containing protein [Xanthobacteraceae bacterium]